MSAKRTYRLVHRRGGLGPAILAGPQRVDQIEIVEIASGEVVLLWDRSARDATKMLRALRGDLAALDADAFWQRWGGVA
jgi:hypothetical protein